MSPHCTATLNPNEYEVLRTGLVRVNLTHGQSTTIDRRYLRRILPYRWHAAWDGSRAYYAVGERLDRKKVRMQRLITHAPDGVLVDHVNGDTLDNTRSNLRFATKIQNAANSRMNSRNKSGFRGVSWNRECRKWTAFIRFNSRSRYLGLFESAEDAARAYDEAAIEAFGAFAAVNFPHDESRAA